MGLEYVELYGIHYILATPLSAFIKAYEMIFECE